MVQHWLTGGPMVVWRWSTVATWHQSQGATWHSNHEVRGTVAAGTRWECGSGGYELAYEVLRMPIIGGGGNFTRSQLVYEPNPSNNYDFPCFDPPPQYPIVHSPPHEMSLQELISYLTPSIAETANHHVQHLDEMQSKVNSMMINLGTFIPEPLVNFVVYKESDDDIKVAPAYTPSLPFLATMEPADTLLMGDEVISTTLIRENDELINSSVDDLVPILKDSEVTSNSNYKCDMPTPPTDVREEDFDINSPLGGQVVDFWMENVDVAGLPRHLVKRLFSHLLKNPSLTKGMSDKPLGDDIKPRSFDVTFSNPLFEFNDDFNLCKDNLLFDEEFEDISSLDPLELTTVIDDLTLLVTLPLPSSETSDLFEELIAEIGLDDPIPIKIDDRDYNSEGDIIFFEQFLNEDTSFDVSSALLSTESSLLDLPPLASKISYDLEELRACFQSSNHAVFDHLHVYIL
uniref:NAC domain-containing protein n=1 Tax=Tanacetum cinerariifolium TaxID=118510 RepID=A0A6L2MU17_TANCI|nr:NAC domain-containing protein [Tanacetum cinerariifolium]